MTWEAWLTCTTVVVAFVAMLRNWAPADVVMMAGLTLLVVAGELFGSDRLPRAAEAVAGLGNSGLITVAVLFVVVAGLAQTGAMNLIAGPILGRPKSVNSAQVRLLTPVVLLSAFLNNTPVVAMFMPVVEDICKRTRISPSKLYMPMAYAATFGGVCTLVGTSTNLIVNGLLIESTGSGMQMFDLAWVGVPCAIAAIAYLLIASRWLIPDRRPAITLHEDPRQYTVELIVQEGGPLAGKTVEEAGLRHLPGLFLVEIERAGELLTAVSSRQRLYAGDQLVFVGAVESVVDLQKMRGLARAPEAVQLKRQNKKGELVAFNLPKTVERAEVYNISQKVRDDPESLVGRLNNKHDRELLLEPMALYNCFQRRVDSVVTDQSLQRHNITGAWDRRFKFNDTDIPLQITGLNTALLCRDDKDWEKKLPIGTDQLALLENRLPGVVRIVLYHHPHNWLCPSETTKFQNAIKNYAQIALCGHMHEARTKIEHQKLFTFQSGLFHNPPGKQGEVQSTFAIGRISIDENKSQLDMKFYPYYFHDGQYRVNTPYLGSAFHEYKKDHAQITLHIPDLVTPDSRDGIAQLPTSRPLSHGDSSLKTDSMVDIRPRPSKRNIKMYFLLHNEDRNALEAVGVLEKGALKLNSQLHSFGGDWKYGGDVQIEAIWKTFIEQTEDKEDFGAKLKNELKSGREKDDAVACVILAGPNAAAPSSEFESVLKAVNNVHTDYRIPVVVFLATPDQSTLSLDLNHPRYHFVPEDKRTAFAVNVHWQQAKHALTGAVQDTLARNERVGVGALLVACPKSGYKDNDQELEFLLTKRLVEPGKNCIGTFGGYLRKGETSDEAILRHAKVLRIVDVDEVRGKKVERDDVGEKMDVGELLCVTHDRDEGYVDMAFLAILNWDDAKNTELKKDIHTDGQVDRTKLDALFGEDDEKSQSKRQRALNEDWFTFSELAVIFLANRAQIDDYGQLFKPVANAFERFCHLVFVTHALHALEHAIHHRHSFPTLVANEAGKRVRVSWKDKTGKTKVKDQSIDLTALLPSRLPSMAAVHEVLNCEKPDPLQFSKNSELLKRLKQTTKMAMGKDEIELITKETTPLFYD